MDDNVVNEGVISTATRRVVVHVIPTDEELMIARSVDRLLGLGAPIKKDPAIERSFA